MPHTFLTAGCVCRQLQITNEYNIASAVRKQPQNVLMLIFQSAVLVRSKCYRLFCLSEHLVHYSSCCCIDIASVCDPVNKWWRRRWHHNITLCHWGPWRSSFDWSTEWLRTFNLRPTLSRNLCALSTWDLLHFRRWPSSTFSRNVFMLHERPMLIEPRLSTPKSRNLALKLRPSLRLLKMYAMLVDLCRPVIVCVIHWAVQFALLDCTGCVYCNRRRRQCEYVVIF